MGILVHGCVGELIGLRFDWYETFRHWLFRYDDLEDLDITI
jgi:hypothetical protein